jgi:hypothetical protein
MPRALLVLAVGGLGTPKRTLQIRRGRERHASGVDPAGEPRRDLLDQPHIAVRIVEREERPVAGALGIDAGLPGQLLGSVDVGHGMMWTSSFMSTFPTLGSGLAVCASVVLMSISWFV